MRSNIYLLAFIKSTCSESYLIGLANIAIQVIDAGKGTRVNKIDHILVMAMAMAAYRLSKVQLPIIIQVLPVFVTV